ncbi:MAG: hypothetical protein CVU52_03455 [Deltaproteobacteria bacterium HGW-Deltaproteobacteria-10]|nr:MAG: hypothetical protein CVU52_03455 [Deltaproteobacteria bacterium HGW-Deltaproteobacteria-10]
MPENQTRGIIAIFLILAIIPFVIFFSNNYLKYKIPLLANQYEKSITVSVQKKDMGEGVYFTIPGTTANQLLYLTGIGFRSFKDFELENGMKLSIDHDKAEKIAYSRIDNSRRLALGMPIDINWATKDDLILIPGIGEMTAQKIIALRTKKNRFTKIEELMGADGIKEKKLANLKQYLYIEKSGKSIY